VQILLATPQEELRRCYQLSLDKGFPEKADAIKSFIEEEKHEQRNPRATAKPTGKRTYRKRVVRPAWLKARSGRYTKKRQPTPLREDQSDKPIVPSGRADEMVSKEIGDSGF
jgi:hypothetical protein